MIRGARRTIDIAQFYVFSEPGRELESVTGDLRAAGERGVRIRFLVSEAFIKNDTITLDVLRGIPRLELRTLDLEHRTGGELHAKYWIVDGDTAFVGSQNYDWKSLTEIQEMGVLLHDRTIGRHLGRIYDADWRMAGIPVKPHGDTSVARSHARSKAATTRARSGDVELVASPMELNPSGIRDALSALQELIGSADTSISIQLLSYTPVTNRTKYWPAVDGALRAAAVRGVKVRLLVSHWNTAVPGVDHLKSLSLIPNIEVRIVTFPEHSTGFIPFARVIHSKYMIVDSGTLWLGTSNWSRDYFTEMRNVELIFRRPALALEAVNFFDIMWNSPHTAPIDVNKSYPKPRRG